MIELHGSEFRFFFWYREEFFGGNATVRKKFDWGSTREE
jgi:hypothetical protein